MNFQQIQRIMKLTALLIVIGVLQVSAGEAQKVTLHEKNVSLSKIFKEIRRQTGYDFFIDAALVRRVGTVSVDVSDVPLKEALDNCFKNTPLTFRIEDGAILVDEDKPVYIIGRGLDSAALSPQKDSMVLIKGKVTDQKGNALQGVTITLKDYNRAITTSATGEFLFLAPNHRTLLFTSVGYRRREVKINGAAVINVAMDVDIAELDVTQVIAYGTTTKRFNTGEQTTVTSKEIENYPVANVLTALQAKVPGVMISQTSGVPGSPVSVNIRGQNGISSGSNPLYIVDGIPYTMDEYVTLNSNIAHGGFLGQNPLNFINPLDLESVDVLKDADATAIYGSRGANGVILITTKKGRSGATRVTLNAYTGISQVPYMPKMLNLQQYLQMRHEAKRNDGLPVTAFDYDINGAWDTTRSTNWAKELLGNGQTTNAQVSVSGGGPNSSYLLSGNYRRQNNLEKLFGGSDQTASVHFSMGTTSQDGKFSASLTGGYTYNVSDIPPGDQFSAIIGLAPDAPKLFNSDGSLNFQNNTFNGNPALAARKLNKTSINNLLSSAVIAYRPLPGLELKATVGYNKQQMNEFNGTPISANAPALGVTTGQANFTTNNNTYWSIEPQATYNRDIVKGRLTATVGYSVQKQTEEALPLQASGYTSDALLSSPTAGTAIKAIPGYGYSLTLYKFTGIYGRVNYIWDNKYLLDLTGRNDGSTKFGPDNRFHFFGAVGAGWIFTEEKFMKNLRWLN
jgi:TonB-linked SusC/RagA family outer membrane protein